MSLIGLEKIEELEDIEDKTSNQITLKQAIRTQKLLRCQKRFAEQIKKKAIFDNEYPGFNTVDHTSMFDANKVYTHLKDKLSTFQPKTKDCNNAAAAKEIGKPKNWRQILNSEEDQSSKRTKAEQKLRPRLLSRDLLTNKERKKKEINPDINKVKEKNSRVRKIKCLETRNFE